MTTGLLDQVSKRDAGKRADARKLFVELLDRADSPRDGDAEALEDAAATLWPELSPAKRQEKVYGCLRDRRDHATNRGKVLSAADAADLKRRAAQTEADGAGELRRVLTKLIDGADFDTLCRLVDSVAQQAAPASPGTGPMGAITMVIDPRMTAAFRDRGAVRQRVWAARSDLQQSLSLSEQHARRARELRAGNPLAFGDEPTPAGT